MKRILLAFIIAASGYLVVSIYGFGLFRTPTQRRTMRNKRVSGYSEGSAPATAGAVNHVALDTASIIRNGDYGPGATAFMSGKSLDDIAAAMPSAGGVFPES